MESSCVSGKAPSAISVVALAQADGEALDVEAAAGEEPGDPREHAGLVLDEDGERVLHGFFLALRD